MKSFLIKKHSKWVILVYILFLFPLLFAFQSDEWIVPESVNNLKNPTKYAGENKVIAKSLYNQHCKSCHGKSGEGDGTKAEELETFPGDLSMEEFQSQTDGAIYYKIREGRDEMPAFDKKLSEEDSWLVVNYLREF